MVRRASPALRLLSLLLLPALCSGCAFFTSSLFPGYLAQVEASVDLGARVDQFIGSNPEVSWYSDLFVLRTPGGTSYAGLLVRKRYLPDKTLFLIDSVLALKQITDPGLDLPHLTPAPDPPNANVFHVGRLAFDLSNPSIITYYGNITGLPGFSDGVQNYLLYIDGAFPNTLRYNLYFADWSPLPSATPNPANIILASSGGYELRGLFYDPSPPTTGEEVILVLRSQNSNEVLVVFTPQKEYGLEFGGTQPILDKFRVLRFQEVDANRVYYTRKGIAIDVQDGHLQLYDLNGAETTTTLNLGRRKQVRVAFNLEGDTFFVFNEDDRIFYKGSTGW